MTLVRAGIDGGRRRSGGLALAVAADFRGKEGGKHALAVRNTVEEYPFGCAEVNCRLGNQRCGLCCILMLVVVDDGRC